MKKIIFTLVLFTFSLSNFLMAQVSPIKIGVRGGVNISDWRGDAVQSFSDLADMSTVLKTESLTGFHAGINLSIPVSGRLSFEPGIFYSTKGMKLSQTFIEGGFLNLKGEISNRLHYIEMPVLAKVYVVEGLYLTGGPQVAYLVSNKVRAEAGIFGFSVEEDFDVNSGFRKFDVGLTGGLGYQFKNGINLSALYDHSLTTLDEGSGDIDAYNRAVKFSIGFIF